MSDYELTLPFVVCQSEGGPYEDEAYAAGFEMGVMYQLLPRIKAAQGGTVEGSVKTGNVPLLDRIAMKYGYTMKAEEESDGWSTYILTKAG